MVTETQDSPVVAEQPQGKPSEAEKGSEAPRPAAGVGEVGKAPTLDFDQLYRENADFRSRFERQVQSRLDKMLIQQRARWDAQQTAVETQRRRDEQLKTELAMDETELGLKRKKEIEQALNPDPRLNDAANWGLSEGEKRAYQRLASTLETVPEWHEMSLAERHEMVESATDPTDLVAKVVDLAGSKRSTKKLEAELAKYRAKAEVEKAEEARATEPSPDTGTGIPAMSDREFIRAFAQGRLNSLTDFARARKLGY